MTETTTTPDAAERARLVRSTRRFDLRRLLGGLFLLYGIICTILGIVHGSSDLKQTGGIAINLWAGIGMIVLALLFFLWDRLAPVPEEDILGNLDREADEKAAGEGKQLG
ncbi:hypothetical protein GCM10025867_40780 [Frondihabitans sucicola]|uniref:DUF485 domain-containing protein n=1 Tax=Frondihabitans sucicola TaxID=1268041 RepID=A0ABN6Y3D4_9MICO|nr:hypothetical protein [Frondihabitans sucicola]BDZ51837.1 hypothetical protein GCM10025867_40780 [Frondihabitans sucicola]